jgi:hypothetical protein
MLVYSVLRKKFVLGAAILPLLIACCIFIPQAAQATSVPPLVSVTTTTSIPLSSQACALAKKASPSHLSDPQICVITLTHKVVTTQVSTAISSASQPNACAARNTATAYDQLRYSLLWIAELDTEFLNNGSGCTPTLLYRSDYMTYTAYGTTGSTSATVYTINHTVTVVENIQTATLGIGMHSCQERGFNASDWPYYSVFYGGCAPFSS